MKKKKFPVNIEELTLNRYQQKIARQNKIVFSFAYQEDLDSAYAFYCARYRNITYEEFLELGLNDFMKLLGSVPKSEPLYDIIKSRTISLSTIKDKNERRYWSEMKQINEIPALYLSNKQIYTELQIKLGQAKKGGVL